MQFNSLEYFAFLLLVISLYYTVARTYFAQKILMIVASAIFYAFWSPLFLVHFFGIVLLNYWLSMWMIRLPSKRQQRLVLWGIIGIDLANLFLFKYASLAVSTANWLMTSTGSGSAPFPLPEILLPLAISFYTFHLISYLVDLYHSHPHAKANGPLDFLFYVTFFPHQIAGPILRGHELFPQLGWKAPASANFSLGARLIMVGLSQKAVIGDNLAIIVDHGYKAFPSLSPLEMYVVLLAYSFQIFFDFAGYSNMAIGSARLFGYELPGNFNTPYIAANISDFWRRWHMTLSRWIRDYIFIPLGGSRGTALATSVNLLITMGLAGLWHGASWAFMVWGLYHGLGLVVHGYYTRSRMHQIVTNALPASFYRYAMIFVTFNFVTLGWVLFRSPDFATAWKIYAQLANIFTSASPFQFDQAYLLKSYGFTAMLVYGAYLLAAYSKPVAGLFAQSNRRRFLLYAVALYLILFLTPSHTEPFIYFQF